MTDTAAQPTVSREELRQEMEAARASFQELLQSLSPDDFKRKSANGPWSNGQLMWHMAWGVGYIPNLVERSRMGKDLNLPRGLFNLINPWLTRWGSRGITPDKVAKTYDEAHAKALAALETVKDEEWLLSAKITGLVQTVEHHFRLPAEHFAEHKAQIVR